MAMGWGWNPSEGSGLAGFGDVINPECEIPYSDLPHFPPPSVEGHPGRLILGHVEKHLVHWPVTQFND